MAPRFRVGEWLVEPERNRIESDIHSLAIEPMVTRLLVYLAERPDETVTREELFQELWGSVAVGDETLTVTVGKLRKALGDDPKAPRFIQTVPKQGYRLIAPVDRLPEAPPRPRRGGGRVIAGVTVLGVVLAVLWWNRSGPVPEAAIDVQTIDSLVVLPSKVHGNDEQQFLGEAVPSLLSTHLNVLPDLEIKLPPSEHDLASLEGDLSRLAQVYGVSALVLSDVTLDDTRVTLNLQLAAATDRSLVWSRTFAGTRENVVDLVEDAADALRIRLRPHGDVSPRSSSSGNREAQLELERGMYYVRRLSRLQESESFEPALTALTRAYELDPENSDAAAEIAWLYSYGGLTREKYRSEIDTWLRRAFDANPHNGRASMLLVWLDQVNPSMGPSERLPAALRAATYAPRDHMGHFLLGFAFRSSSAALAAASFQESTKRYPLYPYSAVYSSLYLLAIGRTTEALEAVEQALRVSPDMPFALLSKAIIMLERGETAEAEAIGTRMDGLAKGGRGPPLHPMLVRHAAALARGSLEEAGAVYRELMSVMPQGSRSSEGALVLIALVRWGEYDDALEHMKLVFAAGHTPAYDGFSTGPIVERFGDEPMVREELARARARFVEMLEVVDAAERRGELPPYLAEPLAMLRAELGDTVRESAVMR